MAGGVECNFFADARHCCDLHQTGIAPPVARKVEDRTGLIAPHMAVQDGCGQLEEPYRYRRAGLAASGANPPVPFG